MAGRGPAPKDPSKRARRNADPVGHTVLRQETVEPPPLPSRYADFPEVAEWWDSWVNSPQAEVLSSTDWQFLKDTLPLVEAYHYGRDKDGLPNGLKYGAEIRLRVAQFGATPADRARLRMTFAAADEAERKQNTGREPGAAKSLYSGLRVVGGATSE